MMDGIEWTGNFGAFNLTVSVVNRPPVSRCGISGNKVEVCHKGKTLCVPSSAVAAHVRHGDRLGNCLISTANRSKVSGYDAVVVVDNPAYSFNVSNAPNPFSNSTRLQYEIPADGYVKITIYDAIGKLIATPVDSKHKIGMYTKHFGTASLPKGVYYYQVKYTTDQHEVFMKTGKMMVIR